MPKPQPEMRRYILFLSCIFYLLPPMIINTSMAMLILLVVTPLLTFLLVLYYGLKQGFSLWLILLTGLLFVPTIFIFYNDSALIYVLLYTGIALIGNGIGSLFAKFKR